MFRSFTAASALAIAGAARAKDTPTGHISKADRGYHFTNIKRIAAGAVRMTFRNDLALRSHTASTTTHRVTETATTKPTDLTETSGVDPHIHRRFLTVKRTPKLQRAVQISRLSGLFTRGTGHDGGVFQTVTPIHGALSDRVAAFNTAKAELLPETAKTGTEDMHQTSRPRHTPTQTLDKEHRMIRSFTIAAVMSSLALTSPAPAQTHPEAQMTNAPVQTDLTPKTASMPNADIVHGWVADYFAGTRGGDAARWASAFADDAVVDDPVGTPVKDTPEAIMQMGEGFLAAFETVGLHESFVHVVGLEAMARWHGRGITLDGQDVVFEGINHFTFNEEGKIVLLRGFFAPPGS